MTTNSGAKSDGSEITVTLIGGPRDGEMMVLASVVLLANLYLSASNAPGVYWSGRGLGVRQLTWLPAPGGRFVGDPIWYPKTESAPACEPPAPPISAGGLTLCR